MLTIGKLGAGQERYYTEKVAEGAEDYYSGEGEAEGYWLGDAAADLGLRGKVDPDQLTAMLTGQDPASGEPLGLRHVPGRGPVPGFDLTLSAPKSVSLAWALGGPEVGAEIRAAHEAAAKVAIDYMQREACWTRRGQGGREFVHGNGFLGAAYLHRSSRAGDPQLHTHHLIANATKGPDGRWTRLYHPAIYDHAKTAGYLYEAQLRHELTQRLGVRWQEVRNGIAEIEGFADEHLREFSTRRQEILEAAGPDASARARQVANLETRRAKERDIGAESLRERWRSKGEEIGLTREAIRATLSRASERDFEGAVAIQRRIGGALTAQRSHFDRRDAIQAVAELARAGAPAGEVEAAADAYLASKDVIPLGAAAKGERYTTRRIWELERRALAGAETMAAEDRRAVAGELAAARVIDSRPSLKSDQRAMVERLLCGGEGLVIVVGEAGTGKTFATVAAAEGWAQAGLALRVAAPTWRAANVLRAEGLEASSIARLLLECERAAAQGKPVLRQDSVLLVDEAGMVDSATLARLIEFARESRAKLVLVGDPAQLAEIEAGGLFSGLVARGDPVVLDQVIRHRHDLDREAAKRIREGEGREALALYRSEDRVVVCADADSRREAMVADWWQSFGVGEDALMVAKRNAEVEKLNALAREAMRAEGRLGEVEIEVGEARFALGDQVITRVNDHRAQIYNRERWRIAEVDARAQSVVLDGIDTRRRVCVDAVYLGRVTEREEAPALQHAYAATTYQAQGTTAERAYVMADPSMDRNELYVATSRTREQTYLYAIPEVQVAREEMAPRSPYLREGLEHIAEAAERDGTQVAAHDQALRSRLGELSNEELHRRRRELLSPVREEERIEQAGRRLGERIAETREASGPPGPRERALERLEAERAALAASEHRARAESAVIDYLLAERGRSVVTAAALAPPPYVVSELGQRPSDPSKRAHWDRAVTGIEDYRQRNGLVDRDSALGAKPDSGLRRAEWERQRVRLQQAQRSLELDRGRSRSAGMEIGL